MTIYDWLKKLGISWKEYSHRPLFRVEDGKEIEKMIPGTKTKNLFLRDQKKKKYFLVSLLDKKRADLKKLAEVLGVDRFSFASESDLEKFLKVKPGAVSPFNLINASQNPSLFLVIDKDILKEKTINFHPNKNTKTLNLKTKDFLKYLDSLKIKKFFIKI